MSTKDKLLKYHFPANVRELKSIIDLACVMTNTRGIGAEDIRYYGVSGPSAVEYGEKTLREYNREILQHYLDKYDHNIVKIAQILDMGKSTIYNMLESGELNQKSNL